MDENKNMFYITITEITAWKYIRYLGILIGIGKL